MSTAKKGDTVSIDYTVKTGGGRLVGGTEQNGPQTIVLGAGEIFPEVEAALIGMTPGEEKAVTVSADNAFGQRDEAMVIEIPRERLAPQPDPQPGMQLSATAQDGGEVILTIIEVGEAAVRADANHPLAGEDLYFALTLRDVKAA